MKRRAAILVGLLGAIIALPLILRRQSAAGGAGDAADRLVILSPHNESIRREFGEAFARHWEKMSGRSIFVDWRTPGGTSEIRMVLDASYKAAAETQREGIGVDVFFGGGEPDFASQAKKGRLMPLRVFTEHPEWFAPGGPVPETFTGERYFPADHLWVGTCMSQFGICYNPEVLNRLKLPPPKTWRDLSVPQYFGSLALADPTKSGSVARTFELIVQGEILRAIAVPGAEQTVALEAGWTAGLQLIQQLSANARYFTDSASKVPHDVGQGNAAAGMCIDFYGRSFTEEHSSKSGLPRVVWIAPLQGTTLSCDPVAVLKGAENLTIAQEFVTFCLSLEGQKIWCSKPATPGGPVSKALHRIPIRRDCYTPEILAKSTMPQAQPYTDPANFIYQQPLTGRAFNTLRQLVKICCIDSHEEMKAAWQALRDAGMPPAALAVFNDVSKVNYSLCGQGDPLLDGTDALQAADRAMELGEWFRANYRKAAALAKSSAPRSNP